MVIAGFSKFIVGQVRKVLQVLLSNISILRVAGVVLHGNFLLFEATDELV